MKSGSPVIGESMKRSGEVVVLGAGPSGLACAYELAKQGLAPTILERGKAPGGLMRSIQRNGYRVDVGRKELYSRLPEVHGLWTELLGDDYRPYPHRVGVLWRGHIMERSRKFRGFFRGIPPWVLAAGASEVAVRQVFNPFMRTPKNEEEYWYRLRGKLLSQVLSQGHAEKFQGHQWSELPAPKEGQSKGIGMVARSMKSLAGRATAKDHGTTEWRHPAHSTGQIVDALVEKIDEMGGKILLGTNISRVVEENGRAVAVEGERDGEAFVLETAHLASSVPLDVLARLLGEEPPKDLKAQDTRKRSTVLVYLFLDEPPRFPHAWLDVTDPALKVGRVANFAGFNGEMVPPGKTCLAMEYFLVGEDTMLTAENDALLSLAAHEAAASGLVDPEKLTDHMILRLPGVFAADDYRSWEAPGVRAFLDRLEGVNNLWNINRAGTDVATYAGIKAAHSIIDGSRERFLNDADPRRPLGINSTRLWA